jgi:FNIP Repeat
MTKLTEFYTLSDLPDTLTTLRLPECARLSPPEAVVVVPQRLEVLDTGYSFNSPIGVLPPTLRELYMKRRAADTQQYEHELSELPYGLEVVHVANMTHGLGVLPDTIEVLHCTNHSHSLGELPNSLKVLKIDGSNFNHSLGLLPDGLVELDLSKAVDFQQLLGVLPQSLKTIKLHAAYRHAL